MLILGGARVWVAVETFNVSDSEGRNFGDVALFGLICAQYLRKPDLDGPAEYE